MWSDPLENGRCLRLDQNMEALSEHGDMGVKKCRNKQPRVKIVIFCNHWLYDPISRYIVSFGNLEQYIYIIGDFPKCNHL